MGIHKFFGYLKDHPRFKKAITNKLPSKINSFFIDCNGIFHNAKADIYENTKSKNKKELERKHINLIMHNIKEIVADFNPTELLVIAPDGGANCAKMNQQKTRRYKSAKASSEPSNNPEHIDIDLFDGNSISPGTEIMFKIDKEIKQWLHEDKSIPKVIYSSHLSEGEGEHLLVDVIRKKHADMNGVGVFYGLDGDLILLTLLSPMERLYLAREDKQKIMDIRLLRKLIREELNFEGSNIELLIQDFCFMVFMIGNDFLHRLPLLHNTINSMNCLIEVYLKTKLHLTNTMGKVEYSNLLQYWKNLENHKIAGYDLYQYHTKNPMPFPYPEYSEATTIRSVRGNPVDELFDSSKHTVDFDKKLFTKLWYEKQFKPQSKELRDMYDGKFFTEKDIMHMCLYYLKVLEWNLGYYNEGHEMVSKNLFYPFFYSPMLPSLINFLEYLIKENKLYKLENKLEKDNIDHTIIHQLMLILPPQSIDLIPEPFRKLYIDKLHCISPVDFIIMRPEGTDADHNTVALIPPINPYLVSRIIKESGYEIPKKYHAEDLLIIVNRQHQKEVRRYKFDYEIPDVYLL